VKNQPLIPIHISKVAKDFILKLLMKNPKRRLGAKGLEDVKRHPFFAVDIDWDAIAQKRTAAPIKPKLKDEMDTSNFADEFTRLPLVDSPGLAPPTESLFRVRTESISLTCSLGLLLPSRAIHSYRRQSCSDPRMQ
jgi:ribosomal protein S6 kinase alpha-5